MYPLLRGLRVVEGASFIAAPSCALHLLQMGAEVIRFDQVGGGPDFCRWPRSKSGASLYWEALNKGKRSVALDLTLPEGRDIAASIVTAPGEGRGLFVTNYPSDGFLSHSKLKTLRSDLITLRVMGWADGRTAIDYTVNATLGLPLITGPASLGDEPVNHVLPAWDLLTGAYGAFALLAAERYRQNTGIGQEVRLPLGDVAMAAIANIGLVGEASADGPERERMGNELFGAFGRDFQVHSGQRIMLTAITKRQWLGLVQALGLETEIIAVEQRFGVSFRDDEGVRFQYRNALYPVFERALLTRGLDELSPIFDRLGVCWSIYRTIKQALNDETLLHEANPIFARVRHPSGDAYLTPGSAATFSDMERHRPLRAPLLGEHTDQVLTEVLGMPEHEIARLHDKCIIAGP